MQLRESISKLTVDTTTGLGSTVLASAIKHKIPNSVIKIKMKSKIKVK